MVTAFLDAYQDYAPRPRLAVAAFILRDLTSVIVRGVASNQWIHALLIALPLSMALHICLFAVLVPIPGKPFFLPPEVIIGLTMGMSGLLIINRPRTKKGN